METKPKFLKWALIIGIVVVLNLFFNYAISLFYKEPDYNVYFPQSQVVEPVETKEACLKVGGQWTENPYKDGTPSPIPSGFNNGKGYCNPDFTKQQNFNEAQKVYQRNIFLMLVVLGIISFVVGAFLFNEIVAVRAWWSSIFSAARVALIWARSFSYSGRRWSTSPGPVSELCGFLRLRSKLSVLISSIETRQACSSASRLL